MKRILGTPAADYLPAFGLLLVTMAYLAVAYSYAPDSRAVPVGVAWTMIGLLALDLLSRTRTRAGEALTRWLNPAAGEAEERRYPVLSQVSAVLWVILFVAALVLLGVLAAVPLYVFASTRLRGGRGTLTCLAIAAGAGLFIWLLFAVVLRLDLYPGLLFQGS